MRKLTYIGVFEPSGQKGYGVYFPDLPGCITCGDSFEHAREMAEEALGLHVYGMEKDGDLLPTPSAVPEIDPETTVGYLLSPITIFPDLVRIEMDTRAVKTNVTLPAWLKEQAEARGVNFSRVLQAALIEMLGKSAAIMEQPAGYTTSPPQLQGRQARRR